MASKQITEGGHWIEEAKDVKQNKRSVIKVGTKGKKQSKFLVQKSLCFYCRVPNIS
jgi:hypothetical protein